ncbi:MAG: right-handed parallel beta-helix repeat-containing protein, partial [Candidatus Thorarchaeota archaeon]
MQKKEYSKMHGGIVISMMLLLLLGLSFTSIPLWYVPTQGAHNHEINIDTSIFNTAGHIPWSVIDIDGDADLASQGWLGDGSSDTPYRIENLNISTASSVERIKIWNTRAHFLIKNCTLIGMTGSDYAIQLLNVSNGVITDNDISGNPRSIEVINSTYVTVINNTCSQSYGAISVRSNTDPTNNVQVLNNTLTGGTDAIRGYNNHELTIAENKLASFTDSGIYIYNSESVSITDNELDDTGYYGLYIDDSLLNSEIFGNTIEDCDEGIYLDGSSSMVIANNSVSLCTNGINFDYADNNLLENNSVSGCSIGLLLDVGSGGNDIIWNFYEGNTVQVTDSGPGNTIRNNYYSDHSGLDANSDGIVDTSYPLAGISTNTDPYPLMNKFVVRLGLDWNPVPAHQFYELGESFSYDLNTTSTIGIDWQLIGSSYYAIDSSGIITNDTNGAGMASYEVHVVAMNYHTRFIDAYFNITSQDTIDPVWVAQPDDEYF